MALLTTTPVRLGGSCSVKLAVVAVPTALVFTKLAVPVTCELTGALAGKPANVVLMSLKTVSAVEVVAVLLLGLVSAVVVVTSPVKVCTVVLPRGTLYAIVAVVVPPLTMLVTVMVVVVPFGNTTVAVTLLAVLGPLLVIVTVAVMVWPGVLLVGALMVIATSALAPTGVTTVAVLFGVGSVVVALTPAVLVTLVALAAVTVAFSTRVKVWPSAKLVVPAVVLAPRLATATLPLVLALIKLRPALKTSLIVTFWAVLGPKLTTVTV